MNNRGILSLIFILLLAGCKINHSIIQGVQGQLLWYEGDQMPGINKKPSDGKPIQREVFVYKLTPLSEVTLTSGSFYKEIRSKLVAKVKSDNEGFFSIRLHPGIYSLFVKEKGEYFTNILDGKGNLNPVVVKKRSLTKLIFRIDYNAAY